MGQKIISKTLLNIKVKFFLLFFYTMQAEASNSDRKKRCFSYIFNLRIFLVYELQHTTF